MSKIAIIVVALLAALVAGPLAAQEVTLGPLRIIQPWARATVTTVGGAYMVIYNAGPADRLVGVQTDVAQSAEMHLQSENGGVMMMRQVQAIDVPPGRSGLGPTGYHIMLLGLKAPLKAGSSFPLKLTFEKAGTVEVMVVVDKPGGMGGLDGNGIKPTAPPPLAPGGAPGQ